MVSTEKQKGYSINWYAKNKDKPGVKEARNAYTKIYHQTLAGRKQQLYARAKERAREKNILFTIKAANIEVLDLCPLLGIPLYFGNGVQGPNSPSLDRKDNSKGYTPENTWVISQKANRCKSDATIDELITLGLRLKQLRDEGFI